MKIAAPKSNPSGEIEDVCILPLLLFGSGHINGYSIADKPEDR